MISFKNLIENSNHALHSYKFLKEVFIYQQISDTIFEKTNFSIKEGEVYDGELVYKKNNQIYLYLGYDEKLSQEVFIPIISEQGDLIIERI
jgi:hypothetical protein